MSKVHELEHLFTIKQKILTMLFKITHSGNISIEQAKIKLNEFIQIYDMYIETLSPDDIRRQTALKKYNLVYINYIKYADDYKTFMEYNN